MYQFVCVNWKPSGVTGTVSGHFNNVPFSGVRADSVYASSIVETEDGVMSIPFKIKLEMSDSSKWEVKIIIKNLKDPSDKGHNKYLSNAINKLFEDDGFIGY